MMYADNCPECSAPIFHKDETSFHCPYCQGYWHLCPDCGNWEFEDSWDSTYGVCVYCMPDEELEEEEDSEEDHE